MHITRILCRVPVIKFRKGMGPSAASAPPPSSASPAAAAAAVMITFLYCKIYSIYHRSSVSKSIYSLFAFQPAQAQSSAAMSSAAISDIDLPLRYQRRPLSQEEIDHINGGGVV